MGPNPEEHIPCKRSKFGEKYWATTRFKEATDYKKECEKLKDAGLKVHVFYVDKSAIETGLDEVAKLTEGEC